MPIEKVEQNRYLSAIVRASRASCLFNHCFNILVVIKLPSEALIIFRSIFGAENIAKLGYLLEPTFNIMALLVILELLNHC